MGTPFVDGKTHLDKVQLSYDRRDRAKMPDSWSFFEKEGRYQSIAHVGREFYGGFDLVGDWVGLGAAFGLLASRPSSLLHWLCPPMLCRVDFCRDFPDPQFDKVEWFSRVGVTEPRRVKDEYAKGYLTWRVCGELPGLQVCAYDKGCEQTGGSVVGVGPYRLEIRFGSDVLRRHGWKSLARLVIEEGTDGQAGRSVWHYQDWGALHAYADRRLAALYNMNPGRPGWPEGLDGLRDSVEMLWEQSDARALLYAFRRVRDPCMLEALREVILHNRPDLEGDILDIDRQRSESDD